MCKYILVKHTICGCSSLMVSHPCAASVRNCTPCVYMHRRLHPIATSSIARMGDPDSPQVAEESREDQRPGEKRKRKGKGVSKNGEPGEPKKDERRIVLYEGAEQRSSQSMCGFCLDDLRERQCDKRQELELGHSRGD